MTELPYLTSGLPGIGGFVKQHIDDFVVDEIPLYPLSGRGSHTWFRVTKRGVPTQVAVSRIARYMGVRRMDIGVAGLKDAQAVTTQMMSIEHADGARLSRYRDSQVRIDQVTWHHNKLRIGHLSGNRFAIRIRGVSAEHLPAARAILDVLASRGVPNYFGEQRFGARGDTGKLGEALVRGDLDEFMRQFLGRPHERDPHEAQAARRAFDQGNIGLALKLWPRHFSDQRRALAAFSKKLRPGAALTSIDKRIRRLFVSAFQSEIFNDVLVARLGGLDEVMTGDLAQKTDTGGVFLVEDAAAELQRARRFEISATGPIVGYRSDLASGEPGRIERQVLALRHISQEDFTHVGSLRVKGSRRPLRFALVEPAVSAGQDARGSYVEVAFSAPAGCYATIALREITKTQLDAWESPAADDSPE